MAIKTIKIKENGQFWEYPFVPLVAGDVNAYKLVMPIARYGGADTVMVSAQRADGTTVVDSAPIAGDNAEYTLRNNMYSIEGDVHIRMTLLSADGSALTTAEMTFQVLSETDTSSITADDRYPLLTQLLLSAQSVQEQLNAHKTTQELDHPDGSVTTAKLADNSVTDAKIGLRTIPNPKKSAGDIIGNLTTLLRNIVEAHRSEVSERENADTALGNNKVDKTQYASVSQAGVVKLYSSGGINRSGIVVYDDGSAVVNTKTERGVTRDGAGQIGINPATEAEITAGTDAYKPIVSATLSHAVQSVTGDLSGLETTNKDSFTEAINEVRREGINADFVKDVYGYQPPIFVDAAANVRVGVVSVTTPTSGLFDFDGFIARDDLKNIIKISGRPVGVNASLRQQIEYSVNGLELEECKMYVVINLDTLEIEEANVVLNDEGLNATDELLPDGRLKLWLARVIPPYNDGMVTNGYCDVSVYGGSWQLDGIDEVIGTLDDLNTTDTSSIIAAINELNNKIKELTSDKTELQNRITAMETTLGTLSAQLDEVNGV